MTQVLLQEVLRVLLHNLVYIAAKLPETNLNTTVVVSLLTKEKTV